MSAPFFPDPLPKDGLLSNKPPRKPSILDRIASRLYQIDPAYESLLSPEDRLAAQRRGLNQLFQNLGRTGNLGESLAGVDFPGIVQQAATVSEGVRQRNQGLARERARADILSRYPPVEGESVQETGSRLLKMLPLFIQNNDLEVAGRLTELLKSMGLGGAAGAREPWGAPFASKDAQGPGMFQQNQETGEVRRVPGLTPYTDPAVAQRRNEVQEARQSSEENRIYGQFLQQTRNFNEVSQLFGSVQSAANDPSPAGDLSMIFAYMKVLDPGSVVREGEFATAANTGSIPQRVWAQYNRALKGERLTPTQRADFYRQAQNRVRLMSGQLQTVMKSYRARAQRKGLNPENVVFDYFEGLDLAPTAGAPSSPGGPPVTDPAADPLLQPRR